MQSSLVLAAGYRPQHSLLGIAWTAVTAAVMFALAAGKARTGAALGNPVLATEGWVTLVDGILATAVLTGLVLNAANLVCAHRGYALHRLHPLPKRSRPSTPNRPW